MFAVIHRLTILTAIARASLRWQRELNQRVPTIASALRFAKNSTCCRSIKSRCVVARVSQIDFADVLIPPAQVRDLTTRGMITSCKASPLPIHEHR